MKGRKRHWWWNIVIVLTLVSCILAFVIHFKNWTRTESDHIKILSGIYYQEIAFSEVNTVQMVDRIPALERLNGFSVMQKEKGVFKDSLSQTKVYVFIDDLTQQKIRLTHKDSLLLFLNFTDSIKTKTMFDFLNAKAQENKSKELP